MNTSVNLPGLSQTVNSNWMSSDKPVPCQKYIKKFIEITGTARLEGTSAADPITIHEFVQIVERDRIQLNPNWKDSGDTFKVALEFLLQQMGVMGEGKASEANGSTASSSSKVKNHPFVDTVHSVLGRETEMPIDLCKIIHSYHGGYGAPEIERFIRDTCSLDAANTKTAVPVDLEEKMKKFLYELGIDGNEITTLDLSGIAWDMKLVVDYKRLQTDEQYKKLYMELYSQAAKSQVLLRIVNNVMPRLQTINLTNWIWKGGSPDLSKQSPHEYYSTMAIFELMGVTLNEFKELEALIISSKDISVSSGGHIEGPLKKVYHLPKLKTLRIIGRVLPDQRYLSHLRQSRPMLVIECIPS